MTTISTKNMTIRKDVPLEILRNAERRRRQAEADKLGAEIIEAIFALLIVAAYCIALKLFIK